MGAGINDTLIERTTSAVESARDLDRALGLLAGELHKSFFLRRVALSMPVGANELLLVGVWTTKPTRLGKGAKIRAATTSFPEMVTSGALTFSEGSEQLTSEVLRSEGILYWTSIPIPRPDDISGMLTLCAASNVFSGREELLSALGLAVGGRLISLAHASEIYRAANDE